jgi:hypothetical protein
MSFWMRSRIWGEIRMSGLGVDMLLFGLGEEDRRVMRKGKFGDLISCPEIAQRTPRE